MRHAFARIGGLARAAAEARAEIIRAEVRAAFNHMLGNVLRIMGAGILFSDGRGVIGKPVARPFPDIADHVVKSRRIRGKATDGREARKTVDAAIDDRKHALPGVSARRAVRCEGFRVQIGWDRRIPARGALPFVLGWQAAPAPARVGERVFVSDLNHWKEVAPLD